MGLGRSGTELLQGLGGGVIAWKRKARLVALIPQGLTAGGGGGKRDR